MSIVKMITEYKAMGYSDREIDNMILQDLEEDRQEMIDDYENNSFVDYGWYQQDIIDMYRRER